MATDAQALAQFYASARGAVAAHLLRERLTAFWPDLGNQSLLGLGYATPYLRIWRAPTGRPAAQRCIALTPAQLGLARWPDGKPGLSCTAEEDALPFADLTFDRILLVHGIEQAEHARRLLREIWRVLKDDGRLLIVAPNRRGMWAYVESTPFGHGQPYSFGQVSRLLAATLFSVERRDGALYLPPTSWRPLLRGAALWEKAGRYLAPQLAGLTLTEAVKDVYAGMPLEAAPIRRLALAEEGA